MRRGIGSTFITVQLYRTVMVTSYACRFSGTQFIGDITGYLNYGWNNYSFISSSKTGNLQTAAVTTFAGTTRTSPLALGLDCILTRVSNDWVMSASNCSATEA